MLFRHIKRYFSTSSDNLQCTLTRLSGIHTGIALIQLNNPKLKNALSNKMVSDLRNIIDECNKDYGLRVGIIRSQQAGYFCAGADLKERLSISNDETETLVRGLRDTFDRVYNIPFPIIACIDGPALGGGLELALSCDIRIGTKQSLIGLPETALAIIPGAGGTQQLARIIGVAKAKELIFTGRKFDGIEAEKLGILNYVEENYEAAYNKSISIAQEILTKGPIGVRSAKAAINAGSEVDLQTGLQIQRINYSRVVWSNDRIEGLKAFKEKRNPQYNGN